VKPDSGAHGTGPAGGARWILAAATAPWLAAAWYLVGMWGHEPERYYGFAVLPLAAYLLFLRWETVPAARPPGGAAGRAGWLAAAVAGALAAGAAGWLLTASPLWTAAGWLALAGAAATTAGLLGRAGGWPWVRHALWPLGFAFTALPWPTMIAGPVTAWLRGANASLAADIVSALGHPAVARGTLIETAGGWAGVEDACSGVTALQTALMLAVFFGELRGLNRAGRLAVLGGAVVLALGINLLRAAWLVWLTAEGGPKALAAVHDAAGFTELGAAIVAVSAWSLWVGRAEAPAAPGAPATMGLGAEFSRGAAVAVLAILGLAVTGGGVWFRAGAAAAGEPEVEWDLAAPTAAWREVALAAGVREMLRCDTALQLAMRDGDSGREWVVLHLRWRGDPVLRYGVALHRPEYCLPNAGAGLDARLPSATTTVAGETLEWQRARFVTGGQTFHTFTCIWDPVLRRTVEADSLAALALVPQRLAQVRVGRTDYKMERITIAVNECRDDAEALAVMAAMAPRLLRKRPE
jgi:exosortase